MEPEVLEPAAREVIDAPATWSRPPPEFVADLSGRRLAHSLFDTARSRHGTARVRFGPVLVYGSHHFHAVMDAGGRLALQESAPDRVRFRIAHHLANPPPPAARVPRLAPGDPVAVDLSPAEVTALPGPVFFASPTEPDNWGMWLLNVLPSVADWQARGRPGKLLCWVRFKWQRALLNFLGVPDESLVAQQEWRAYAVPGLTMHQYTAVDLVPTATDQAVFRRVAAMCGAPEPGGGKLFVSRKGFAARFGHRRLLDEDALIAALAARGFRTLEPETLPFREQVRAFRGARMVVGLGGAAMFSTVFCEPGTRLVSIESGPEFAENHASLFAAMGHRHGFILGRRDLDDPAPSHQRWSLDVAAAVRHIDAFTG
jgi:hypothetical protein